MVLKLIPLAYHWFFEFENDVKTYGTETMAIHATIGNPFENDVKTYGTETEKVLNDAPALFENDVKTYGTETENV